MGDTDSQRMTLLSVIAANDRRILKAPRSLHVKEPALNKFPTVDSQPTWAADNQPTGFRQEEFQLPF